MITHVMITLKNYSVDCSQENCPQKLKMYYDRGVNERLHYVLFFYRNINFSLTLQHNLQMI